MTNKQKLFCPGDLVYTTNDWTSVYVDCFGNCFGKLIYVNLNINTAIIVTEKLRIQNGIKEIKCYIPSKQIYAYITYDMLLRYYHFCYD